MFRLTQNSFSKWSKNFNTIENFVLQSQQLKNCRNVSQNNTNTMDREATATNPQNLPHLPVQPLVNTINRYLKSVQPLLSEEDFCTTECALNKFMECDGPKLQKLLENRATKKENWLSDWWLNTAYLEYRDPVVVFSSPGLVFPKMQLDSTAKKIKLAARIITAALNFKNMIDTKQLPVEKAGKNELDMAQYGKVFGTCRIPGLEVDSLVFNKDSKHIIFAYKNNFFKVPVYGGSGQNKMLSEKEMCKQLEQCLMINGDAQRVGILTTDNRNNWGEAYTELIKDPINKTSLCDIETALFVVAIDDCYPSSLSYNNNASHQLIHGGGPNQNSANRWFDKTIQFIIGYNGINGLTYEHSPAEGQPVAILTDQLIKYINAKDIVINKEDVGGIQSPRLLHFRLNPILCKYLVRADNNIEALANNLDMNVLHFKCYGKEFIKSQKMSPDSYLQMAMQYAYYRYYKKPAPHYESAHHRLFVHGRTETIRSCSNESLAFAKEMMKKGANKDKIAKLKAAVQSHKEYSSAAVQGSGVDRHILGLKLIAKEHNIPLPEFYSDPSLSISSHWTLSTSQVASRYEAFMCYGPAFEDGYGLCYNPRANDIIFAISSLKSNPTTSSEKLGHVLSECLMEMHEMLSLASDALPVQSKL